MITLFSALAPIQLVSIIALAILLTLCIAIFAICLIRALKVKRPTLASVNSLDKDFLPDAMLYARNLSSMLKLPTVSSTDDTPYSKEFKELIFSLYPNVSSACQYKDFNGGIMLTILGKNHTKPLVLMSHFDVASAGLNWERAPFSGDIQDGIVYGRGAVDTKGNLCAILEACDSLIKDGFSPSRDIIIFSSSKEEVAGTDAILAADYLKQKGITPILTLDEGGAMLDNPLVGVNGNFAMIAMCERSRATLNISAPSQKIMDKFIKKANKHKLAKPAFTPEVRAMFKKLTPHMSFIMRFIFANLWLFEDLLLGLLPKLSKEAKAMICPTFGFSAIAVDDNTKQHTAIATLASTYYVDIDGVIENFKQLATRYGVDCQTKTSWRTCKPEPLNSDGYKLVADTVLACFNNVTPCPFVLFGGTDSRHFASVSDSVIRFAPLHLTHQEFASFHNANEQIHIDAIAGAVCFFRELIKKCC